MRKHFAHMIGVVLFCLTWAGMNAQADKPSEYQIRAAYIYNFANFVGWPSTSFADSTAPFVICIVGDDPFGAALDQIVKGELIGTHPIVVERLKSVDEIKDCHILYCMSNDRLQAVQIVQKLKGLSVLSVGEFKDFATIGGIVRFIVEEDRVRFELNIDAAKGAKLAVSSKLQKVALRIIGG
jgi:hypothetical protein